MSLDEIIAEKKLHRTEGVVGVKNLARICAALGYHDGTYFGQFENGCYGNLINFLEDNSGAVEAVIEFIREHQEEWLDIEESSDEDLTDDDCPSTHCY